MPENSPLLTAEQINAYQPPPWLATWRAKPTPGADGRPYYHVEIDGCDLYATPKTWRGFVLPREDNPMGQFPPGGVDIQDVHRQNPGAIVVTPGAPSLSAGTEVPRSIITPEASTFDGWEQYLLVAAIVGCVGCIIFGGILAIVASVWGWRKIANG